MKCLSACYFLSGLISVSCFRLISHHFNGESWSCYLGGLHSARGRGDCNFKIDEQFPCERKKGKQRWWNSSARAFWNENSAKVAHLSVINDVIECEGRLCPADVGLFTLCPLPCSPNAVLRLRFSHFATECSWDHMYVYDGDSIYSPLIAVFRWAPAVLMRTPAGGGCMEMTRAGFSSPSRVPSNVLSWKWVMASIVTTNYSNNIPAAVSGAFPINDVAGTDKKKSLKTQ